MPHRTVPNGHTYEILVVDDNPADSKLLEMAFAECNHVSTHVSVLRKCSDVIDYVFGRGKYADARRPDLIIVDYHMPLDGGMALVELKGNPHVQCTPVLVMTGTDNPSDVDEIYRRHANACFLRPIDLDSSGRLVCSIAEHWLTEVMLPPPPPHQHGMN